MQIKASMIIAFVGTIISGIVASVENDKAMKEYTDESVKKYMKEKEKQEVDENNDGES